MQINRLQSTAARSWAQRFIPPQVRELVLSYVTGRAAFATTDDDAFSSSIDESDPVALSNRVAKFWSVLFSHRMHSISLPAELDEKTRKTLFMYLGSGTVIANWKIRLVRPRNPTSIFPEGRNELMVRKIALQT